MIQRCSDPKSNSYEHYGGRGIRVCERWLKFENFHRDMGKPPKGMTIERADSNGNYEPSNCRWATRKEQAQNKRGSLKFTRHGQTLNVTQWAFIEGVPPNRVYQRLRRGWTIEQALQLPYGTRLL